MNVEPLFLNLEEILEIHRDQIARYGGHEGIRDLELLKSAMGMPPAAFGGEFLHTDLFEMAAAYLYHLVRNHPFIDGNKRVGTVAALVFLALNGHDFTAPGEDLEDLVVRLAGGGTTKAEVTIFIRNWARPR